MKRIIFSGAVLWATACSLLAENEKSMELKVLDRFVGTWDIDGFYKPVDGERMPFKGVSHRRWSADGKTIHFDDPGSSPGDPGIQILLTYNPDDGSYPGVTLAGPARGTIKGVWNEENLSMTFTGTLAGETGTFDSVHRFVDADHAEPTGVFKNPAGEVVAELSWKQTRRKQEEKVSSVDDLLSKYHEAMGGFEANRKVTTRRIEGTFAFLGSVQPAKLTVVQKAPDLGLTTIESDNTTALEGFDGKVLWKSNPAEGTVEIQGEEEQQRVKDYHFYKYLDLKADYKSLTLKGQELVKGTPYHVLEATQEDGTSETLCFNVSTHRLELVRRPGLNIEMSNYRKVDGISYPAKTVVSSPDGMELMTVTFDKIEQGIEVDDSIFRKPEE